MLREAYVRRQGTRSTTELMRASGGLGRAEVAFGLRELAQGGWVRRGVAEIDGRLVEVWAVVEEDQGDSGRMAAE
jgi:hypothetical protein